MKIFIRSLLLFCLLPVPFLFLFAYVVDSGLRKSKCNYYAEWNDVFHGRVNADIIVLGASRALVHVSPKVLDSMLHCNSYNLGISGSSFPLQYEQLKIYLRYNRKPKIILQEVSFSSTLTAAVRPDIKQFLPYLYDSSIVKIVKNNFNTYSPLDRYFPLYKYNNEGWLIMEGLRNHFGRNVKSQKYKGYIGINAKWRVAAWEDVKKANSKTFPVDTAAVSLLRNYLGFCRSQNIKVVLFFSPVYYRYPAYVTNKDEILNVFYTLAHDYDAVFLNYMNDSISGNQDYFYNPLHMNAKGAETFTADLANKLRSISR
jgi:hypothetical protein